MNKLLLGTTAIVGASLVMAGGAYAAKPKVKVNGGIVVELGGSSQDLEPFQDSAGPSSAGPLRGYAINTSSEIHINVSGKTDAGMKWKSRIEFETDANVASQTKESSIDEVWIRFSGSWGQIRLGNEDGAEDLMHISGEGATKKAGAGGVDGHWDDFVAWREVNKRFAHEPTLTEDSSDATKISYFTPRVGGLQVGVSFTPDTGSAGQAFSTDNGGDFENSWGIGVQFKKKFGGVKVAAAGVVHFGDTENEFNSVTFANNAGELLDGTGTVATEDSEFEDLRAWMVGAEIGYGGWKLGGAYQDLGDGGPDAKPGEDSTAWDVGLGYSSGPVILGLSYLHAEVDIPSKGGEDEGDTVNLGATYMLGGGARVYAEVFWFDTESAESSGTTNDGYGFIIGAGVKF
jgi:predicted porin